MVDRSDDGVGPDDGAADDAGTLGEAQQYQRSSWRVKLELEAQVVVQLGGSTCSRCDMVHFD